MYLIILSGAFWTILFESNTNKSIVKISKVEKKNSIEYTTTTKILYCKTFNLCTLSHKNGVCYNSSVKLDEIHKWGVCIYLIYPIYNLKIKINDSKKESSKLIRMASSFATLSTKLNLHLTVTQLSDSDQFDDSSVTSCLILSTGKHELDKHDESK